MHVRADLKIDVNAPACPGGKASIAATVWIPQALPERPGVMVSLPGGGYARGYFDLHFAGRDGYSEAEFRVRSGWIFVAMDHLGVGDSTTSANETLLIEDIAAANDAAVRKILGGLREGSLVEGVGPLALGPVVGSGQSMGGGLTIIMQGRHQTYDAIAPLGYSAIHTMLPQRDAETTARGSAAYQDIARGAENNRLSVKVSSQSVPDYLYPFHWDDVPADIIDADVKSGFPFRKVVPSWGSATIPNCVVAMMSPGFVKAEASAITAPVFIGLGERDVSPDPHAEPSAFANSADITLFVAARMAHMHNFAGTRAVLWRRLQHWCDGLEPELN